MPKKNRCSRRTSPAPHSPKKKSPKTAPNWRKMFFQIAFKAIEAIWMIVQVIQYICEILRK